MKKLLAFLCNIVNAKAMHITHVSSELAPIAKVGGLADVVFGLTREHTLQNHLVSIVVPKYDCLVQQGIEDLKPVKSFPLLYEGEAHQIQVWSGVLRGVQLFFLEDFHPKKFFKRKLIYGCSDDIERFLYFSYAAVAFLEHMESIPDLLHLHDWPTAAVAPLVKESSGRLKSVKLLLTIHNMEYQGLCKPKDLLKIDLPAIEMMQAGKIGDNNRVDLVNILKGGIVYCDFFTTVSPSYAKEVLTQHGCGLEKTIQQFTDKFSGVLNGIDYEYWDPQSDPLLTERYCYDELLAGNWKGKERAKRSLQKRMGLQVDNRPLIGCVTRLVAQKGLHLLEHAMNRTKWLGGQFVLLGTSPDETIQAKFEQIGKSIGCDVKISLQSNEELAHQIFAGCDMILVPSLFEPCGLTQMIAMRYGTIAIVRRTGGLADTVFDVETADRGNGFTFDDADLSGVNWGIDRALYWWKNRAKDWQDLVLWAMNHNFSWKKSATLYLEIYKSLLLDKSSSDF